MPTKTTGITNTLLSSQKTRAHQGRPLQTDCFRGNSPTLPARPYHVKLLVELDHDSFRFARAADPPFSGASNGRGVPADRPMTSTEGAHRPAPAGLITLPARSRDLKSIPGVSMACRWRVDGAGATGTG